MELEAQDKLFERGMALFRRGALNDAARSFRQRVDGGSVTPLHLSYCGLLAATVHGRKREGRELCERALEFGADEPEVVSNLARLYESNGEHRRAIRVLRRGLRATPEHPALLAQIQRLSPRQEPPLSLVHRNNPVNKLLAIGLARISGRYGATATPGKQADAGKAALRKLRKVRQS
jgi:tetratricopeptide (TPR) repeat protein